MSRTASTGAIPPVSDVYDICVEGHLADRWVAWFDGLTLSHERDGTTLLRGPVADQAALHGLLQKVRDLGLPLVSVTRSAPGTGHAPPLAQLTLQRPPRSTA